MNTSSTRASEIQNALYRRYGYGHVSLVSRALGYHRVHVSRVLNGERISETLLDRIEAWLEEQEDYQEAA